MISLRASRNWWILVTVGIGTLLSSMTNSITNTVLPVIAKDLGISLETSSWVSMVYLLVLIVLLLPVGRLCDLIGRHVLMIAGFVLFGLSSAAAALSRDLTWLLVARGVSAASGALLLATGPAVLSTAFPLEQRGQALGWQALITYFGLAVGPILGGWLAQWARWPAVFWVAVPISLLGMLLAIMWIPRRNPTGLLTFDTRGTVTFMVGMVALTLLLNPSAYPHQVILGMVILGIIVVGSTGLFVRRQWKFPDPLIDLRLFRSRNFSYGTIAAIINYLCFFVGLFLLPFYLNRELGWSSGHVGLLLTLMPALMMIIAPWAGRVSDSWGSRELSTAGMLANALGLSFFGAAEIWKSMGLELFIAGAVFMGAGTGLFAAPNNAAIMKAAPMSRQGVASGTLATARYVGMIAGITLGSSVLHLFQSLNMARAHPFMTASLWVWATGAVLGVVGCIVTLSMERGAVRMKEDHRHHPVFPEL